jgi:hypothetical protein
MEYTATIKMLPWSLSPDTPGPDSSVDIDCPLRSGEWSVCQAAQCICPEQVIREGDWWDTVPSACPLRQGPVTIKLETTLNMEGETNARD